MRGFAQEDVPLRALVCNAGLQFMGGGRRRSAEGFELTFAVNHLGHFLLTNLLLRRLLAHAPSRIVVVASGVHDPALTTGMPKPDIADFETLATTGGAGKGEFDGPLAYVNSKLCNLWFCYERVRRLEERELGRGERPLSVNGYEPGLVPGSGLARDYSPALRFAWNHLMPGLARLISPFYGGINTAPPSGNALAERVLDPKLQRESGLHFPSHTRWSAADSSVDSYDVERAGMLWDASVRMTTLGADESPLRI